MSLPVVLLHGYSDKGKSFERWQSALAAAGYDVTQIHTCNYETLTNEASLQDIAEGFDRALRIRAGLDADEPFDAIVHSTGMLVIRAWLAAYASRRSRLKHLVALAPASFGSPLAHKGRSWLGAIFKGNKELGSDFLEAGNRVLDALELGSRFTWDLAHRDLLGEKPCFGPDGDTPYVFIFCGTEDYSGLQGLLVNEPGTDGTVRWAGCPLNTRKITVDLTVEPGNTQRKRFEIAPWSNIDIPLIPVKGVHHGSILRKPTGPLVEMVKAALRVSSREELTDWYGRDDVKAALRDRPGRWQQFIVRAVDERGDPIPDYNLQLFTKGPGGREQPLLDFQREVHVYRADPSFRAFHVNLDRLKPGRLSNLWMRVIASSGSRLVGYHGYGSEKEDEDGKKKSDGKWDAVVDISDTLKAEPIKFFYPLTTTLVEIRLNREPLPLTGRNDLVFF